MFPEYTIQEGLGGVNLRLADPADVREAQQLCSACPINVPLDDLHRGGCTGIMDSRVGSYNFGMEQPQSTPCGFKKRLER